MTGETMEGLAERVFDAVRRYVDKRDSELIGALDNVSRALSERDALRAQLSALEARIAALERNGR